MASELSDYLANALLNWVKSTAFPADPAAVYVALHDGDPTGAGTGGDDVTTDIRTAGRVAVTFGSIASRAMANSADVDFGLAVAGADLSHFSIWDAQAAGNMLAYSPLTIPRTILAGDPVVFPTGDLEWNFN